MEAPKGVFLFLGITGSDALIGQSKMDYWEAGEVYAIIRERKRSCLTRVYKSPAIGGLSRLPRGIPRAI